jgi:hypothetical protein
MIVPIAILCVLVILVALIALASRALWKKGRGGRIVAIGLVGSIVCAVPGLEHHSKSENAREEKVRAVLESSLRRELSAGSSKDQIESAFRTLKVPYQEFGGRYDAEVLLKQRWDAPFETHLIVVSVRMDQPEREMIKVTIFNRTL